MRKIILINLTVIIFLISCGNHSQTFKDSLDADTVENSDSTSGEDDFSYDDEFTFRGVHTCEDKFAGVLLLDCNGDYEFIDRDWDHVFWPLFKAAYIGEMTFDDGPFINNLFLDIVSSIYCKTKETPQNIDDVIDYFWECLEEAEKFICPSDDYILIGQSISSNGVVKYPIGAREFVLFNYVQDTLVIERITAEMKEKKKVIDYDIVPFYKDFENVPVGAFLVYIKHN